MRPWVPGFLVSAMLVLAAPAFGDPELEYTLDSTIGYGAPTNVAPDADICSPPNCVLFTGTLYDTDTDGSSYLFLSAPYTNAADGTDFAGILSLDNISPTGVLSSDINYATDGSGNPPNIYAGPIFGIDIPVGTPEGVYVDTVNIDVTPTNGNLPFTVSETVTVVVPEPAAACLLIGGLAALTAWCGVKRCIGVRCPRRSSEALH